ncbi:hypothetical protein [Phaeodactylibacter luteus]|uniref:Uncharacterized protein n=1 Tax=Phaeodactylibacter luteus TaxID=1564516 RepID=A0A5C6RKN5_9BACT|nr:hypothetical protein [Phaeodactylibacter luteus]TXB62797.1 hypothetical protein FRY97_12005 [Phaeodactylibacter luteus]
MQKYLTFALLLPLLSSCGPTLSPFTQQLYEESRFTPEELQQVQFYLSSDIILTRELTGSKAEVVSGEIRMIDGRQVEQVVFRKGTPGVVQFFPGEERLAVAFEGNGEGRYLIFGPNPSVSGRYTLRASDWQRRTGVVTYEGKKWRTGGEAALATLLIDLDKVRQTDVRSRVASGRRVD